MRTLSSCKKGNLRVYFAVMVVLFLTAFSSIMGLILYTQSRAVLNDNGLLDSDGAQQAIAGFDRYFDALDYFVVLIMFVLIIGVAVTSYRLPTRAAYFLVTFFYAAFLGLMGYVFNLLFSEMSKQPIIAVVIAGFPLTTIICTNMHWVGLLVLVVGSIALYAKKQPLEVQNQ